MIAYGSGLVKKNSEIKILEALSEGPKTWSQLLTTTGLSRRTLQLRLSEMEAKGDIGTELSAIPGQRKRVLYMLSERGHREFPRLRGEFIEGFAEAIETALKSLPRLGRLFVGFVLGEEYKDCVSFHLVHEKHMSDEEEFEKHVRTALSYILSQYVAEPDGLKEITGTNFNITFQFDKDAVEELLREKEEAEKRREPLFTRPPPNPDDFLLKQ